MQKKEPNNLVVVLVCPHYVQVKHFDDGSSWPALPVFKRFPELDTKISHIVVPSASNTQEIGFACFRESAFSGYCFEGQQVG